MWSLFDKKKWLAFAMDLRQYPARTNTLCKHGVFIAIGSALSLTAIADGNTVDKVYHPYVDALEQELEWRTIYQDDQPEVSNHRQLHRFAYGRAFGDRWFGEIYLTGENSDDTSFKLKTYELEAKWQLTEQGEYWEDWGLRFEIEKEAHERSWEFSTGILVEKEWGRWSGTANFTLAHEWGSDIQDETETSAALQMRYRLSRWFEPALELYAGEDTQALGPVIMGDIKIGTRKNIHWETGMIFGLTEESANNTMRFLIEYEF
jgi:hypothetical protein